MTSHTSPVARGSCRSAGDSMPRLDRILVLSQDTDVTGLPGALEAAGCVMRQYRVAWSDVALRDLAENVAADPPDAVVYDLDAPSSARADAFLHIRALPALSDLPWLMVTSESDVLHRLLGPMAVYDVLIETPCQTQVIVRALRIMLDERCQRP